MTYPVDNIFCSTFKKNITPIILSKKNNNLNFFEEDYDTFILNEIIESLQDFYECGYVTKLHPIMSVEISVPKKLYGSSYKQWLE